MTLTFTRSVGAGRRLLSPSFREMCADEASEERSVVADAKVDELMNDHFGAAF